MTPSSGCFSRETLSTSHTLMFFKKSLRMADTAWSSASPPSAQGHPAAGEASPGLCCGIAGGHRRRCLGACVGLGTAGAGPSKMWTVMCLKTFEFLGLQTCKSKSHVHIWHHLILNSARTKAHEPLL